VTTRIELTPLSAFVLLVVAAILAAQCFLVVLRAPGEPIFLKLLSPEAQAASESSSQPEATQPLFLGQPKP